MQQGQEVSTAEENLATRLASAMHHAGVGSAALARQAGVSTSFIQDILHGKSQHPSVIRMVKVANALRVPMTALLPGKESAGVVEPGGVLLPTLLPEQENRQMFFCPDWLWQLAGDNWGALRWHVLSHENTLPKLMAGTQLIVHSGQRQPKKKLWFMLHRCGMLQVASLQHDATGLWYPLKEDMQPDNALTSDMILGTVVWLGQPCINPAQTHIVEVTRDASSRRYLSGGEGMVRDAGLAY